MSEDDRATKAARAKALLNKKRQQKKVGGPLPTPGTDTISPPASRAFSPAPSEPAPVELPSSILIENPKDLRDLFTKDEPDTSWISSLPRVESQSPQREVPRTAVAPSPRTTSAALVPPTCTNDDAELQHLRQSVESLEAERISLQAELDRLKDVHSKVQLVESQLTTEKSRSKQLEADNDASTQNHQRTISLLVSEKTSLMTELERLAGIEARARDTDARLEGERAQSQALSDRVQKLVMNVQEASKKLQQVQGKEKELTDKCRDQERELQIVHATIAKLQGESAQYQLRVRELEEQIQSDDRVEKLEESLKNTQDRGDELEFQLTKLKQAHQTLKGERESLASQVNTLRETEAQWKTKHSEIDQQHATLKTQLDSLNTEKSNLLQDNSELSNQVASHLQTVSNLEHRFAAASSELSASARQLQNLQNELRIANRRAEDAERTQTDLQSEGTNLLRSVDEMRPKIVELTGIKLELSEKVDDLERNVRSRDATIADLESSIQQMQEEEDVAVEKLQEALTSQERDRSAAQSDLAELQKAYAELQIDLDSALTSVHALEVDRGSNHQEATRRLEEITRLTKSSRAQAEELSVLRQELQERSNEQAEDQNLLDRLQNEIESLRQELLLKDDEIDQLRRNTPPNSDSVQSLDHELLGSLKQQHALDLSAAHSQIRALENAVFEAQAKSHNLQKRISALEQAANTAQRPFSPGIPSRPSSRSLNHPDMHHRPSLGSHRSSNLAAPPLSRSLFDQSLSPETRHKRKVSLSMLKARIDSEAASSHPSSRTQSPAPGRLPTVNEPSSAPALLPTHIMHRPQFLDESHIFWCHSCRGDLVIL